MSRSKHAREMHDFKSVWSMPEVVFLFCCHNHCSTHTPKKNNSLQMSVMTMYGIRRPHSLPVPAGLQQGGSFYLFTHTHRKNLSHPLLCTRLHFTRTVFHTHTHALIFSEMLDWRPWCIHAIYAYIFCIFVIVKYTFIMQPPIFTDDTH